MSSGCQVTPTRKSGAKNVRMLRSFKSSLSRFAQSVSWLENDMNASYLYEGAIAISRCCMRLYCFITPPREPSAVKRLAFVPSCHTSGAAAALRRGARLSRVSLCSRFCCKVCA